MSRPRKAPEDHADDKFRREIRVKQGYYDLMTQTELAVSCDIPQSTLSKRIAKPENFTVAELRKLVSTITPDPLIILGLLGYSTKDIKTFAVAENL